MAENETFPPIRHVFIDTEVFVSSNFQFDTGILASLREAAREGRVRVVMTDIVMRELKARLASSYEQAKQAVRRARNQGRILRNLTDSRFAALFDEHDDAEILGQLESRLHSFLDAIHPKIISVDKVRPSKVFARYFEREPPFGSGKKKSEFPDAFSLEALRTFCVKEGCRITLVSGDSDLEASAGADTPFDYLPRLDALLAELQAESEFTRAATAVLEGLKEAIREEIASRFPLLTFVVLNRPALITRVETSFVSLGEVYVVDVDETQITFSLIADISYEAYLQFAAPITPPSTRAPDRYAPESTWGHQTIPVIGRISWDPQNPEHADIQDIILEVSEDIGVEVEGDSGS